MDAPTRIMPIDSDDTPSVERSLLAQRCRLLYAQSRISMLGGITATIFIAFALREQMPLSWLVPWALLVSAIYGWRFANIQQVLALDEDRMLSSAPKLMRTHLAGTLSTGALWGLGTGMVDLTSVAHASLVTVLVAGMSISTLANYAPARWNAVLFSTLTLLPLAFNLLSTSSEIYLFMGWLILAFIAFLWLAARRLYEITVNSLHQGIVNARLVAASEQARDEAESLNNQLKEEIIQHAHVQQVLRASEQELSSILDNIQDVYYRTDLDGKLVRVSPSVRDLLQYEQRDVLGTRLSEYYAPPSTREKFLAALNDADGELHNYVAHMRCKDGSTRWVATNSQYVRDEAGNIIGVEGTTRDVTQLKHTEEALFEAKERAEVTLRSIGDGVITTGTDGRVDYLNPVAEQLTGWSHDDAIGRPLDEVFQVLNELTREPLTNVVTRRLECGKLCALKDTPALLRKGGGEHSIEASLSPICNRDGDIMGSVLVFHDVTELRGLARKMSHQATHDALTGLINRGEFERRLELLLNGTMSEDLPEHALMYIDLDRFKLVNDSAGHVAGDELLRQLTARLQLRVRGNDVLARLGGDEFGVLLENCSLQQAMDVAEDLRRITRSFRFDWEGKVFEVGASIGIVRIDHDSGSLSEILNAADSACFLAKDMGRDRVHVYTPDDKELARRRSETQWVHRVKHALAEDRLCLYCQTAESLDPAGGDILYREILLRMYDERGELVPPMAFMPALERFHTMPDLDRWVMKTALQMLGTRRRWKNGEIFSINLSGQSLGDESFQQYVVERLQKSNVPLQHLCFEVTETAAIANLVLAARFIDRLKAMGCHFALDDFGSGLSSFGYLKQLPVDYLKIDGNFVHDIANDAVDHAMVDSINRIGHVFDMRTIAEYAETKEIIDVLRTLGVDYAQGNGVQTPVPLQECLD